MHELGIAQQMADIAIASIPRDIENPRVERLNLKIGKLAAVVEDSLRFCLEIISKDTPLEGAKLFIEEVPVRVQCNRCNHRWQVDGPVFKCPECGFGEVKILSGRELEITSLELAD